MGLISNIIHFLIKSMWLKQPGCQFCHLKYVKTLCRSFSFIEKYLDSLVDWGFIYSSIINIFVHQIVRSNRQIYVAFCQIRQCRLNAFTVRKPIMISDVPQGPFCVRKNPVRVCKAMEKSYSVQQPSVSVWLSDNEIRDNLPGNSCTRQPVVVKFSDLIAPPSCNVVNNTGCVCLESALCLLVYDIL